MSDRSTANITEILCRWRNGDAQAPEELIPLVYRELHQLARQHFQRERRDHTLQPTALVHEAYLRLADQSRMQWHNRAQFFGVASQLIRRILVDYARAHAAEKRGGHATHISLDEADLSAQNRPHAFLELEDALIELAGVDPRKSRVVELRFFGGLSIEETAQTMGVNSATVRRDWTVAKAWLYQKLSKTAD